MLPFPCFLYRMVLGLKAVEKNGGDPLDDPRVGGGLLDMWSLYRQLSPNQTMLSNLTIYDLVSQRDGLLFPDFFNAVRTFVREKLTDNKSADESVLERELEETFTTMHNNWSLYEPFFNRHPELRYLKRLRFNSFALGGLASNLPKVRSLSAPSFWSLNEYHKLRGNLEFYVKLDEALMQQSLGTIFEKESDELPGTILVHLKPFGPNKEEIAHYLPLLKHGNVIGFCSLALSEVEGTPFVAVTSLQTDLLRKDYVKGVRSDIGLPTTFFPGIKKNEDWCYTVPPHIGRQYLRKHSWVHEMLGCIEKASYDASGDLGLGGVLVPTTDFSLDNGFESKRIVPDRLSECAQGSYDAVPGKRGYKKETAEVNFMLTNQKGSGAFWIKSFR